MPDLLPGPWLDRPLAGAFLRFNLALADWGHPSQDVPWQLSGDAIERLVALGALPPDGPRVVRRHASATILQSLEPNEVVVPGFSDPALPVFMASAETFERLQVGCGLVLLAPAIRRVITREELQALRTELTSEELGFARGRTVASTSGDFRAEPEVALALGQVRVQARKLGQEVLAFAAQAASPPVACRARLRLPPLPPAESLQVPAALRDGAAALAHARAVLQEVDPEWLSLFPASP